MKQNDRGKSLAASSKKLLLPLMVLVSLALHGLLLWMPLPASKPQKQSEVKKQPPVKLVRLPAKQLATQPIKSASLQRSPRPPRLAVKRSRPAPVASKPPASTTASVPPAPLPSTAAANHSARDFNQRSVVLDDLVIVLNQYLPAEPTDFSDPGLFYQQIDSTAVKEHPDSDGGFRLATDADSRSLFANLQSELLTKNFQVALIGDFGGGQVYEVTQGEFKRYLNLLPSKEGTGTLIVLWSKLPSS